MFGGKVSSASFVFSSQKRTSRVETTRTRMTAHVIAPLRSHKIITFRFNKVLCAVLISSKFLSLTSNDNMYKLYPEDGQDWQLKAQNEKKNNISWSTMVNTIPLLVSQVVLILIMLHPNQNNSQSLASCIIGHLHRLKAVVYRSTCEAIN